jgi:hypothetical protein
MNQPDRQPSPVPTPEMVAAATKWMQEREMFDPEQSAFWPGGPEEFALFAQEMVEKAEQRGYGRGCWDQLHVSQQYLEEQRKERASIEVQAVIEVQAQFAEFRDREAALEARLAAFDPIMERAAQIVGSEYRNPGVVTVALDHLEARLAELGEEEGDNV